MKTLRQAQAERLREYRALARAAGDTRLDPQELQGLLHQVETEWFQALDEAAWQGSEIPNAVWRSARAAHEPSYHRIRGRWTTRAM